ncbi:MULTISPECIES: CGNR zinc finger domain-containing protein [unclassified Aeromicrobium]|jgi:predicted RNA-binding Zn ribbon-like protein|uniref:CGNR zinc finger domain-containing protein n=1 Tax=unclassified Aeromicrobium TaxID=2633570 RepID=UPI000A4B8DE6|nr:MULTISPECIES: CGNR zinc finger domain-containing protein [unclassified Aeromicrobium]
MVFAHDTEANLLAAVELANSAEEPDTLTSVAELDGYYERHGYTGRHDRDRAELDEVRALRATLRRLMTAELDEAVAVVNDLLAAFPAQPRLVNHGPLGWHLHVVDDDRPLHERIALETAVAFSEVVTAGELSRFATCADDGCDGIVLDLSRNRSRRFCSTTCGNRHAAAEYRARQREQEQA